MSEKTITIKLTDEEHRKFVEICRKIGKRRSFFVKEAVVDSMKREMMHTMIRDDCELDQTPKGIIQ
jgi:predicted transcriptional regulator